jgi:hypothetical protein
MSTWIGSLSGEDHDDFEDDITLHDCLEDQFDELMENEDE